MTETLTKPDPTEGSSPPRGRTPLNLTGGLGVLIIKLVGLGTALGLGIALTPTLIATENWAFLAVIWAIVIALFLIYATGRMVPGKYLFPGALFLVLFLIYPIVLTFQLSTTNYGDGTRTTREAAISRIIGSSAVQEPGADSFALSVGTSGSVATGPFTYLLVNNTSGEPFAGTEESFEPLDEDAVTITAGKITAAEGYTILSLQEINAISAAGGALDGFAVPASDGTVIRAQGFQALEMRTPLVWDEETEQITNTDTGTVYSIERSPSGDRSFFVDPQGERLSTQSWGESIGWFNFNRIFTDNSITGPFIGIFVWTVVFAFVSVLSTFALGLFLAIALNEPRLRFQRAYRSLLILPYAIPGFISLLVWSGFWNRDFGLVNNLLGTNIDWLGQTGPARAAVLLTNLWLGFPYMFLIATGALQSIPSELKEAASIDGASGFVHFRKIVLPLLLISTAPLLVSSFAFNFNNFNAIQLLTQGGPFSPANPTAGGTDILISYTYRLAFGQAGQQIGFASAVSVVLFILTGIIAALQFRGTRKLEEMI